MTNVLNSHPDIHITYEMRTFLKIDQRHSEYWSTFRRLVCNSLRTRKFGRILNIFYYLMLSIPYLGQKMTVERIRMIKRSQHPNMKIVGDKYPRYWFHLDKLSRHVSAIKVAIIYRDGRDVIASFFEKQRADWSDKKWSVNLSSVNKVAQRWENAINIMEKQKDFIHVIRYEELVESPKKVLSGLARYLYVDAAQFDHRLIQKDKVGNYKNSLSLEELNAINSEIGNTLVRLGYF